MVGTRIAQLRVVDPHRKSGTLDDYGVAYLPIAVIEIAILTVLPLWVAAGAVWMPGLALTAFAATLLLVSWKSIGSRPIPGSAGWANLRRQSGAIGSWRQVFFGYSSGNVSGNMTNDSEHHTSTPRVNRHRLRASAHGNTRVEVSIPLRDAPLLRSLARALREDDSEASRVRRLLETEVVRAPAATGADLVEFLLASPLREMELEIERDRSSGRPVDFE